MPLNSKWRQYEALARSMSLRHGVAPELILAVMQAESVFDPRAYRAEPQIGDASRGLMQLLLRTARGLGFTGPADQLYDAAVNADLGTKLLAQNLRARGFDMAKAVSQYNGGYRPALGFGEERSSTGMFGNQAYVDKVLGLFQEYNAAMRAGGSPPTSGGGPPAPPSSFPVAPGSSIGLGMLLAVIFGAFVLWRGARAA